MNLFGWFRKSSDTRNGAADAHPAEHPGTRTRVPTADPAPPGAGVSDAGTPLAPLLPAAAVSPEEVRKLLFDAVAAGDEARLETLCREHRDFILAERAGWLEVPQAFRTSPEAYTWYGNGLRAIARFCSEKVGESELLQDADRPSHQSTLRH